MGKKNIIGFLADLLPQLRIKPLSLQMSKPQSKTGNAFLHKCGLKDERMQRFICDSAFWLPKDYSASLKYNMLGTMTAPLLLYCGNFPCILLRISDK